eukprot:12026681-Ditylum_brightwellii.AAC.1
MQHSLCLMLLLPIDSELWPYLPYSLDGHVVLGPPNLPQPSHTSLILLIPQPAWKWMWDIDIFPNHIYQWDSSHTNLPAEEICKGSHLLDDGQCLADLGH